MAGHQQKPYGTQQPYAQEAYPVEQPYAGPTAQEVTVVGSTVTAQPLSQGLVGQQRVTAGGRPPRTYCFLAWFSCLFCCLPIGLGAVIMSYLVTKKMRDNDFEGAYKASRLAKRLALLAIIIGILAQVSGWTSYSETDYSRNNNRTVRTSSSNDY